MREYHKNGLPNSDYQFQYVDGLLKTLKVSQMYNIIGSKCIVADLQSYYIVQGNRLISIGTYLREQYNRLGIQLNILTMFNKGYNLYSYLGKDTYISLDTRTNKERYIKNLPKDCISLY